MTQAEEEQSGTERGGRRIGRRGPSAAGHRSQEVTMSGLTGTTHLVSVQLLDECITLPLPKEGQVPAEAPLVSACTFYILYEACSASSFSLTLADLRRRHVEEDAALRVKPLE